MQNDQSVETTPNVRAPSVDFQGSRWGGIDLIVLSIILGLVGLPQTPICTLTNGLHDKTGNLQHETGPPGQGRTQGQTDWRGTGKGVTPTYVKGHLSPGPDVIISELLKDTISTERRVILHWINGVLTSEEPGLRLSMKEVHGLVALLHKASDSTRTSREYYELSWVLYFFVMSWVEYFILLSWVELSTFLTQYSTQLMTKSVVLIKLK